MNSSFDLMNAVTKEIAFIGKWSIVLNINLLKKFKKLNSKNKFHYGFPLINCITPPNDP